MEMVTRKMHEQRAATWSVITQVWKKEGVKKVLPHPGAHWFPQLLLETLYLVLNLYYRNTNSVRTVGNAA